MIPQSISEKLMFNTVRLQTNTGYGTGFFFNFLIDGDVYPTVVTNKHVVNNKEDEEVTFYLHLLSNDSETKENYPVTLSLHWFFHSKKDICFTFINPVLEEVKRKTGKDVFYVVNGEELIPSTKQLEDLTALEEVVMVGYPIGLWDKRNNYPIFRKGYTAAHPAIDFNEDGIGLVDMTCLPGSSGSPIYILNEGGYRDKKGSLHWGQSRVYFLGVLYAGPQYTATGDVVVKTVPTVQQKIESQTRVMANLGFYIKSSELQEFRKTIKAVIGKKATDKY